jgi:hypothetical protein
MRSFFAGLCLAALAGAFSAANVASAQDAPPAAPAPATHPTLPPPHLYLPVKPPALVFTGPHFHHWGHGPYYTFVPKAQ